MAGLGDPLRDLAREIEGIPKAMMLTAVKTVKRIAAEEAARAVGADLRMSGVGRRAGGAKLALRDDLEVGSRQTIVRISAPRGSGGAWSIVTYGARGHEIGGARSKGRGRSRKQIGRRRLVIGGNVRTGPVKHPGSRGKGTFERVVTRAQAEVVPACEKAVAEAVARAGW